MIILRNLRIVFKSVKDCKLKFYEKRRLFSYFIVNPRTPASRWRRLLKLKRININSFKIIIGFFFTPPLLLAIKVAISFVYRYTTYNANKNRWPTAHKLVFFILLWVNFVLPWVNFVLPWVNFVVPWQFWATVGHRTQLVGVTTSRATSGEEEKTEIRVVSGEIDLIPHIETYQL